MKVKFRRFIYNLAIDRIKIPSWLTFIEPKDPNRLMATDKDGKQYIVADSTIYPFEDGGICDTSKAIIYNPAKGVVIP